MYTLHEFSFGDNNTVRSRIRYQLWFNTHYVGHTGVQAYICTHKSWVL